ncbi:sulfur carrier protein ThiS [Saccharothrix coeruleofusca]|uniref:Thiamine biosynthesis protein ThiS n=1 Tax=Saccharothrix coeruleofusca TaxID=33919 RepID=A0A918AGW8_9PSEU|nr:sulfur carrier protein ThiS [Saccharothrix coeruleofusca]MBP2340461.1 sulfur carrier protein [Saccharothrix coeruleofusca]GGP35200.1 thiamine biosynthesis protein ThiS [Saccharothrix coeruleofusca]
MKAKVNGRVRELAEGATVATVVALLGTPPSGVAVALDGEVVPRAAWDSTAVPEGGAVEVLTAVQGG